MTRATLPSLPDIMNQQGASALLTSIISLLRANNISKEFIIEFVSKNYDFQEAYGSLRQYRKLLRDYEDMGIIMSTWFSEPRYLDNKGRPLPVSAKRGSRSISGLVRLSRVKISTSAATELMRRSPSIGVDTHGNFIALKRVFVLTEFEVPRAALIIERYLDTLRKNSSAGHQDTTLLLERNCHVSEIDLNRIAPILRDIKGRGTAFMDSVDGDIESHRQRRSKRSGVGELGVLIFAWTRPSRTRIATPRRTFDRRI
jgi:hypothetical protein